MNNGRAYWDMEEDVTSNDDGNVNYGQRLADGFEAHQAGMSGSNS